MFDVCWFSVSRNPVSCFTGFSLWACVSVASLCLLSMVSDRFYI